MPPRSEEPRRDATGSRRGSSRDPGRRGTEPRTGEPGVGGISDARAYTPRGRTVREQRAGGRAERESDAGRAEQRRTPRSTRSGDPFRPA
ncbi:penicillin-binding protein 2, partial [Micromonospora sp. NPDC047074]